MERLGHKVIQTRNSGGPAGFSGVMVDLIITVLKCLGSLVPVSWIQVASMSRRRASLYSFAETALEKHGCGREAGPRVA
jgi:hypothetical protein